MTPEKLLEEKKLVSEEAKEGNYARALELADDFSTDALLERLPDMNDDQIAAAINVFHDSFYPWIAQQGKFELLSSREYLHFDTSSLKVLFRDFLEWYKENKANETREFDETQTRAISEALSNIQFVAWLTDKKIKARDLNADVLSEYFARWETEQTMAGLKEGRSGQEETKELSEMDKSLQDPEFVEWLGEHNPPIKPEALTENIFAALKEQWDSERKKGPLFDFVEAERGSKETNTQVKERLTDLPEAGQEVVLAGLEAADEDERARINSAAKRLKEAHTASKGTEFMDSETNQLIAEAISQPRDTMEWADYWEERKTRERAGVLSRFKRASSGFMNRMLGLGSRSVSAVGSVGKKLGQSFHKNWEMLRERVGLRDTQARQSRQELQQTMNKAAEAPESDQAQSPLEILLERANAGVRADIEEARALRLRSEQQLSRAMNRLYQALSHRNIQDMAEAQIVFEEEIKPLLGSGERVSFELNDADTLWGREELQLEIDYILAGTINSELYAELDGYAERDPTALEAIEDLIWDKKTGRVRTYGSKSEAETKRFFENILRKAFTESANKEAREKNESNRRALSRRTLVLRDMVNRLG